MKEKKILWRKLFLNIISLRSDNFDNWFVWKLLIHNIESFIIESLYCKKEDLFLLIHISEWKNEINEILFILWYKKNFYIKLKYILKYIVKYFIFIIYIF